MGNMQEWAIYLEGKYIDSVWFTIDCCRDYVKLALVNHDGYNPKIEPVKTSFVKKPCYIIV